MEKNKMTKTSKANSFFQHKGHVDGAKGNRPYFKLKEIVRNKTGVDKETITTVLDSFLRSIMDSLIEGRPVCIRKFGTFYIKTNRERGRLVFTKENTMKNRTGPLAVKKIPAHCTPDFTPCKELKKEVKENNKPYIAPNVK